MGQGKGGILLVGKGLGGRVPTLEHLGRERSKTLEYLGNLL